MRKKLFVTCYLIMLFACAQAQVGREFWFAAPDVSSGHGDDPIVFRITAIEQDANITVSMPADGGRIISQVRVAAKTQQRIDLDKDMVENHPSDQVNNKGILITSDADITAYYEVANGVNPDKFTLKGHNGIGNEFFIPSQNTFRNKPLNPIGDEKVDIVATMDNTTITIIPTVAVVGHPANKPYTIVLNRAQTYCIENINDSDASSSLAGTHISSDKSIAVTISDDSVWQGNGFGPYDLIGDQLIPTAVIGTEYIAVNTNPDDRTINKLYVLATQDDTYVSVIYQSQRMVKHLNMGEQLDLDIEGNALYVEADKPVYAYQLASLWNKSGNEMGSAVLPSASCTGSRTVSFVRTFTLDFWVQLLAQQKDLNNFVLRNQSGTVLNDLNSLAWEKVEGTGADGANETWYSAIIKLDITTGSPHTIENTGGLFHMSVLDENQGSVSYGYFSSFGQLRVEGLNQGCQGDAIVLSTTTPMKSYNWFSDYSPNTVLSDEATLSVTQSGRYWVTAEVNFGGCKQTDSIAVEFKMPEFDLGPDTIVCPGETVNITVPDGLGSYEWSDGSSDNTNAVSVAENETKEVWLTVTDELNCANTDRKQVATHSLPNISLYSNAVCMGERVVADTTNIERFEWSLNGTVLNIDQTQNFIEPKVSGSYQLTVWGAEGCSVSETFDITVHPLPSFTMADQLGCLAGTTTIESPLKGAGYSYKWSDGSTGSNLDVNVAGDYSLEITDANGCAASDDFHFDFLPPKPFDLGEDREECAGITLTINQGSDYSDYKWSFQKEGVGDISEIPGATDSMYKIENATPENSGRYYVTAIDRDGCALASDVRVSFVDAPDPTVWIDQALCEGKEITVSVSSGYENYRWWREDLITGDRTALSTFNDASKILVSQDGKYEVEAVIGGCQKVNEIKVLEHANPSVSLVAPDNKCSETTAIVSVDSFTPGSGAFDYLVFDGGLRRYTDWKTAELEIEQAGTYRVEAFDEYGCSAIASVDVGTYATTSIELPEQSSTCENVALVLSNPVATARSYDWYKITAESDQLVASNTALLTTESGSYRLVVEDANGCMNSDTAVVRALPVPAIELGVDREMCAGDTIVLEIDDAYAGYRWNGNDNLNKPYLAVTVSNNYSVEVTNEHGCKAQDAVQVVVNPLPVLHVNDVSTCSGELGTLTVPAGLSNFYWSNGATTPSITVTRGLYTLTAKSDRGCVGETNARVNWYPVPDVYIGPDTAICPVDTLLLTANGNFDYYEWHNGDTGPVSMANIADTVNVVKVRDEHGCWGFDTRMVYTLPAPDYELCPDTALCEGDSIMLDAGYDYLAYRWFDGSPFPTYHVKEPGEYWVRVLDGCFWLQDTTAILFNESPIIAQLDTTIYGQVGVLAQGGTEPYRYAINEDNWQESNVFKDLDNGSYILQVQDANTCMAVDTVMLNDLVDITVPNFVTPNNDGFNDRWEIDGLDKFPDSVIKIYDRFGKLLVEYKASEEGWNGEYLGRPAPSDAYWYVIEVVPLKKMLKGHITLKR
ncbi:MULTISPECIES: T9SS type B sorting domain-containing protein [unclassified Carboxylicivirga]|uniref:T9SS type B sorting domain-containing protein n=1 Tax=Carboxylicivirga TaxID=1628153 RepID=UPI003D35021A